MCCGSRRSAWRNASAPPPTTTSSLRQGASDGAHIPTTGPSLATTTAFKSTQGQFPSVTLHYIESSSIRLLGPVTGRSYDFSQSEPSQSVDVRDAAVLTRTGPFRRSAP